MRPLWAPAHSTLPLLESPSEDWLTTGKCLPKPHSAEANTFRGGHPSQGSAVPSISKIRQGAQEPFSDFVRRLSEAAERFVGPAETDSELIRYLASENASSA